MFKFNFSSEEMRTKDTTSSDTSKPNLEWDQATELDLPLISPHTLPLDSSHLRLMTFDAITVKLLKRERALQNIKSDKVSPQCTVQAEQNNSDLLPAKYEGGLKVWECSEELAGYMVRELGAAQLRGRAVLDLGCGAGLVGITALCLGAESLLFQDYNQEVLTHWTYPNVSLNMGQVSASNVKCKFWSGDWDSFSEKCNDKFDIIFTSETIYNPDNYGKLCNIFKNNLNQGSTVYLAAKSVYFSLGGSVQLFLSHIKKHNEEFAWRQVFKSDDGVQRVIVEMKHKATG